MNQNMPTCIIPIVILICLNVTKMFFSDQVVNLLNYSQLSDHADLMQISILWNTHFLCCACDAETSDTEWLNVFVAVA